MRLASSPNSLAETKIAISASRKLPTFMRSSVYNSEAMALVKCPDCGRDVSTAAAACPQCGRPMAAVAPPQPQAPSGKEETLWHGTPSWLLLLGKIIRAILVAIVLPLIYYFGHDFLAPYAKIVWAVIAIAILWQIVEVF